MSLPGAVAAKLKERGDSSPVELAAFFPRYTHNQIRKALQNASRKRLCHVIRKVKHPNLRGWVAIWRHGPAPGTVKAEPALQPRGRYAWIGRVSSVFDLGLIR